MHIWRITFMRWDARGVSPVIEHRLLSAKSGQDCYEVMRSEQPSGPMGYVRLTNDAHLLVAEETQ